MRQFFNLTFLLSLLSRFSFAQEDYPKITVGAKIGVVRVKTNYGQLSIDYKDQSSPPNHLGKDFSLDSFPLMIGGEIKIAGIATAKGWEFEGLNIGYYRGRTSDLFQLYSGIGYEIRIPEKKINIRPGVNTGISQLSYFFGNYEFPGLMHIGSKTLTNNIQVDLIHNSFFMVPHIDLSYQIKYFALSLSVGYRAELASRERLLFTEIYRNTTGKSARIVTSNSILYQGNYINRNCFDMNAVNITLGAIIYIEIL